MRAPLLVLAVSFTFVAALVTSGPAHAQGEVAQPESPAAAILRTAIEKQKDPGALEAALADLDAMIAKRPKDAEARYARGWVLSRLQRSDAAVADYDKALALDGKLSSAAYNAGVVLARAGNPKAAVLRFDRALAIDPKHVDAAYNAGQSYYDGKQFAKAAERWTTAGKLTPDDFDTAKKLVQAYMALGKDAEAAKARDRVFALKRAAKDPKLAQLKSYVMDQFDVGKHHVYVYEAFETTGDLAYVYKFEVTEQDRPLGSVNLETSTVIREQGVPFILGMDQAGKHTSFSDKAWKTQPAYKVVKAEAIKKITASF